MKNRSLSERENYLRALEFSHPEWIPVTWDLGSAWVKYGQDLEDVVLRHPLIFTDYQRGSYIGGPHDPFYRAYDSLRDDWGCLWRNTQPGLLGQVVGHPLADWKALETFRPPDPLEQYDWRAIRAGLEADRQSGRLTRGYISITQGGFFDRLQFLRGMANILMDFASHAPQLDLLLEMVLDYNVRYVKEYLKLGVDQLMFHGDVGTQRAPLLSPRTFRRYLKPAYTTLFGLCRQAGTHVWYSSDGRMVELADDLRECGVTLHDPQVGPNSLAEIAGAYLNKKLCALVDLNEQLLPFDTPAGIRARVKTAVETLYRPEGGLMFYLLCNHDTPLENIDALCASLEEFCF